MLYLRKGDITRFSGDVIVNAPVATFITVVAYVVPFTGQPGRNFWPHAEATSGLMVNPGRGLRFSPRQDICPVALLFMPWVPAGCSGCGLSVRIIYSRRRTSGR